MIIWSIWRKWSRRRNQEREAIEQNAAEQLRAGDDPAAAEAEDVQRVMDAGSGAGETLAPPDAEDPQPDGD